MQKTDHENVVNTLEKIFESYAGSPHRKNKTSKKKKKYVEKDDDRELDLSDIERSWKSTRRKLRERDESIRELRERVEDMEDDVRAAREERERLAHVLEQNEELRDKTKFLEAQLSRVRKQASEWSDKYVEMEDSVHDLKKTVVRQTQIANQVEDMEKKAAVHEAAELRLRREYRELHQKYASLKTRWSKHRAREKVIMKEMNTQSQRVHKAMHVDAKLRSDVMQLQIDNRRLVEILCGCEEYHRYQDYFKSSSLAYLGSGEEVSVFRRQYRDVTSPKSSKSKKSNSDVLRRSHSPTKFSSSAKKKNIKKKKKLNKSWAHFDALKTSYSRGSKQRPSSPRRKSDKEIERWIPRTVMELTQEFHREHLQHISPTLIYDFLRQINVACQNHARDRVRHARKKFDEKLATMKRRLQHNRPYREVILEDRVTNLSHQLRDAKLEVSIRQQKEADSKLEGGGLFTKSVAIAENLSRDIDELQQENQLLKQRLGELGEETIRLERESNSNTHFFVEGASWVARNLEFMLNQVRERVTELEHRFRYQFDSISSKSSSSSSTSPKVQTKKKERVLRRWADKSHTKLHRSDNDDKVVDEKSNRGLWRLHDLLFDRIAHELSSLERRVHRVVQDASKSWDDREKQIAFLHSLPLDAPSRMDSKSPVASSTRDDYDYDDDDDDLEDNDDTFQSSELRSDDGDEFSDDGSSF